MKVIGGPIFSCAPGIKYYVIDVIIFTLKYTRNKNIKMYAWKFYVYSYNEIRVPTYYFYSR